MRLGLTLSSLHMITKSADDNTVNDNQDYSERHDNQEPRGMITKSLQTTADNKTAVGDTVPKLTLAVRHAPLPL